MKKHMHAQEESACREQGCREADGCCHAEHEADRCVHTHHEDNGCCHAEHEHEEGCCHAHHHEHGCACEHEHGCACGHDHGDDESVREELPRLIAAFVLLLAGLLLPVGETVSALLLLACYLVAGYDVLRSAVSSLGKGRMLNENFLMAIASVAAIAIGEVTEGCAVMLFYQVGECFQSVAVGRSRKQIKSLLKLKADEAFVLRGGTYVRVDPAQVAVGEEIRVRPGERVPLDAVVLTGMSDMDTSALTGESVVRPTEAGESILAGFVSTNGVVTARVTKPLAESSVSRILSLVEDAQERKAPAERFITVFARVYTPIVVGLAVVLAVVPPMLLGGWRDWFYRALTFLVASCPCALVISVPLCYFAGIGSAARRGILIKGGDSLDALCKVEHVVLDKTGTLTTGEFSVAHIHPAAGYAQDDVLAMIAACERDSSHPLGTAAVREAQRRALALPEIRTEKEIAGRGVQGRNAQGEIVLAGSAVMMRENGVDMGEDTCTQDCARIYVSCAGRAVGWICLSDVTKPGAKEAIAELARLGVKETVMLTGDREAPAQAVAKELGIGCTYAQLLPEDKLSHLEEIGRRGTTAFVGDGMNDAPALSRADVGIAMGALGSDAAIEAADIVLMTDEMDRLPQAIRVAVRVRKLARENVVIALSIKVGVLVLAALGVAGMWAAVFADVGVALICVLNAMRAMK